MVVEKCYQNEISYFIYPKCMRTTLAQSPSLKGTQ